MPLPLIPIAIGAGALLWMQKKKNGAAATEGKSLSKELQKQNGVVESPELPPVYEPAEDIPDVEEWWEATDEQEEIF